MAVNQGSVVSNSESARQCLTKPFRLRLLALWLHQRLEKLMHVMLTLLDDNSEQLPHLLTLYYKSKKPGKRYTSQESSDFQEQATNFFAFFGKLVASDALPFLRWMDIGGNERLMRKTAKEFDIVLQEWLDEHKMKRVSGEVKGDEDFMYVMLSLLDDNAELLPDRDSDSVIKATCLVILKETMRLYPAAPLLLPHESIEECTPERFLTTHKDVDVRGQNFELIPFGSGRRICPGISFALQVMQLMLASLLHGFDFATPSNEPVVMEEAKSFTYAKAAPLEVLLTPRLSAFLYDY
ncbi:hypothetical protein WN944_028180 [Citrus x changshan-huyou]|uniref:Cytochrome P450 n=1 Tax=Citrus x changshan-huyou TaxID=2935761 RepID=A0AAP0LIX4_9ROSI